MAIFVNISEIARIEPFTTSEAGAHISTYRMAPDSNRITSMHSIG